jgi:hypothetical protein
MKSRGSWKRCRISQQQQLHRISVAQTLLDMFEYDAQNRRLYLFHFILRIENKKHMKKVRQHVKEYC